MNAIPTAPPSGFRDFLPEACARRAETVQEISKIYRAFGFQQISTSAVEDLAVLLGKGGGENEKLIFKLLKRGDKLEQARAEGSELADLGLRFDLTLPLARYYSKYGSQLPHPFKAFNIGPVWRAERAQKGRYREFYQCDVDVLGSESSLAEIEVIQAITSVFHRLLGNPFPTTHLNDRGLLFALLDQAEVPLDKRGAVCILLDKLDKVERQTVLAELESAVGGPATQALEKTVMRKMTDPDSLADIAPEPAARLKTILASLRSLTGLPAAFIFDPSLIRGFDYYTGTVFEFRAAGLSGSLGGGGRYDRLTEAFGGQKVPACGGSIGFERLMLLLEEKQLATPAKAIDVCMIVFSEEVREAALKAASSLRHAGLSVDVFPGCGKLKTQFKYADAKKAAYAVVIGPDEAASGQAKLKDMSTGQERLVSLETLAVVLRQAGQKL